jgi:carboxypeptidase D
MKLSTGILGALLCASTALASFPRKDIRRPKPLLEKKTAGAHFQSRELQKRADKFLTDKSKGVFQHGVIACGIY